VLYASVNSVLRLRPEVASVHAFVIPILAETMQRNNNLLFLSKKLAQAKFPSENNPAPSHASLEGLRR
jgi:hypothetical protein